MYDSKANGLTRLLGTKHSTLGRMARTYAWSTQNRGGRSTGIVAAPKIALKWICKHLLIVESASYLWVCAHDSDIFKLGSAPFGHGCWILLDIAGYCWILLDIAGMFRSRFNPEAGGIEGKATVCVQLVGWSGRVLDASVERVSVNGKR